MFLVLVGQELILNWWFQLLDCARINVVRFCCHTHSTKCPQSSLRSTAVLPRAEYCLDCEKWLHVHCTLYTPRPKRCIWCGHYTRWKHFGKLAKIRKHKKDTQSHTEHRLFYLYVTLFVPTCGVAITIHLPKIPFCIPSQILLLQVNTFNVFCKWTGSFIAENPLHISHIQTQLLLTFLLYLKT